MRSELPTVLAEQRLGAVYVDTSGPEGYWRTLRDWWRSGGSFIVLEQDKIPAPGLLRELWDCERPWCVTPVSMRGVEEPSPYPSLACVKFDASLMARYPAMLDELGTLDLGFGEKEWSRLDLGIAGLLGNLCDAHWHAGGRVEHLHDA